MDRIFNMDNKFFTFMSRVADLIILNILCIVCCIPIVTIGASVTALYTVTLKAAKNEESYIVKSFFQAFKNNFKQATVVWLIFLVIGTILSIDLWIFPQTLTDTMAKGAKILFSALLFIEMIMVSYVFPIIAKFFNTTRNTIKNSFLMAVRHLPYTILITIVNVIPVILILLGGYFVIYGILVYLLVGFALEAFINSFMFNKIFTYYIPKEEPDEIEKSDEIEESDDSSLQ